MSSAQTTTPPAADADVRWHYLAPIAILYFFFHKIKEAGTTAVYIIAPLAVFRETLLSYKYLWLPAIAVVLLFFLGAAYLSFRAYRFKQTSDSIEIRSGIFAKQHLNLPFERVQNVSILRPFYYRLSQYCCVRLDSAGSADNEVDMVALTLTQADHLKQAILRYAPAPLPADQNASPSRRENSEETHVILKRSKWDLALHGLTNNRIWVILGVAAPFYQRIVDTAAAALSQAGIDFDFITAVETYSWWQSALLWLCGGLLLSVLITLLSMLGSIILYYGYTLRRSEKRYTIECGWLNHQETNIRLSRIQAIRCRQSWLDVLLKRSSLLYQNQSSRQHSSQSAQTSAQFMVPAVTDHEKHVLVQDAFNFSELFNQQWHRVSPHWLRRNLVLIWLSALSAWLAGYIFSHTHTAAIWLAMAAVMLSGISYARWRKWGVQRDAQYVYIRNGFIGQQLICFPSYKVQQITIYQSRLMRSHNLVSVTFVLASGAVTLPYIPQAWVSPLVDQCLYDVETGNKSWM